jgi:hypothetical protein
MSRWSNSALVLLGGTDRNIVLTESLLGEDVQLDVMFTAPTPSIVTRIERATNKIYVSDHIDLFQAGQKIGFSCKHDTSLYTIQAVNTLDNSLTLVEPVPMTIQSDTIEFPIDLTNYTLDFKVIPRKATVVDGRNGLDIESIDAITPGAVAIGTVITSLSERLDGRMKLHIPAATINTAVQPFTLDTDEVIMLTGYYSITSPVVDATPASTKKQRITIVTRTDGVTI